MTNISVLGGRCLLAKIRKCVLCDSAKKLTCKPRVARNLSSVYCIIQQKKFYLSHSSFGWHMPGKFWKSVAMREKSVICLFLAFNRCHPNCLMRGVTPALMLNFVASTATEKYSL
ncbi:hypothetical protein [Pantoea trifolii]|uniref:hypothetical protein n=1 Tax=Candidatus Pantoea symbiotica TaxID=1884370 RepID=UPI000A8ACA7D|nr:hypothetical protein [Pantoea rodasii]MDY0926176.1 hypothetical protein [Enterobacter sp. CFBP8995]